MPKNLSSLTYKGLAGVLVIVGVLLFGAGSVITAVPLITLLSILAIIAGAVVAVVGFVLSHLK